MPRFADLKCKDIEFVKKHRVLILALIEELFEDGVLGRRDWEIIEFDTRIILQQNSEVGDEKITFTRREDDVCRVKYTDAYCTEEDLILAIRYNFGSKEKTLYESQSEEERRAEQEKQKEQKLSKYGDVWARLQVGSALSSIRKGFDGDWKLYHTGDLSVTYKNTRTIIKHNYKMTERFGELELNIRISDGDKPLRIRLEVEYSGGVNQTSLGSKVFYISDLDVDVDLNTHLHKVIRMLHEWEDLRSIS